MLALQPRFTSTYKLFPYTTLCRAELAVDGVEHHEEEAHGEAGPGVAMIEGEGSEDAEDGADQRHLVRRHSDACRPASQHQCPFRPEIFGEDVGDALIGSEVAGPLQDRKSTRLNSSP